MIKTLFSSQEEVVQFVHLGHKFFNETCFNKCTYNPKELDIFLKSSQNSPVNFSAFYTVDNKIVGIVGGKIHTMPFIKEKVSTELFLYVDEEHRNSSIASDLLQAYEEWSKTNGATLCLFGSNTGINPEGTRKFITKKHQYVEYGSNFMKEI